MNVFSKLLLLATLALSFTACEELGELESRKGSSEKPPEVIQASFWELPQKIQGIRYRSVGTEINGTTGSDGLISCMEQETVEFSVGPTAIGSAICSHNITLAEIAGVADSKNPRAVQLLLFLLSLDDDNNPNNGVNIVDGAINYNGDNVLNLDDPTSVATLIQILDPGTPVLDAAGVEQIIDAVGDGEAKILITSLLGVPITNLTYTNATGFSNVTDLTGRITCVEGELITFSVGSLILGSATCSVNMTLEEIAGSPEGAIQLMVLLLSIDNDNDPDNGIYIVDTATDYDGDTSVDLTDPTAVNDIVQVLDPGTPVITDETATDFINDNPPTQGPLPITIDVDGLAVAGLTYTDSNGVTRTTDGSGQIVCQLGETVSFYIGTVLIGSAECSNGMSIQDIAGGEEEALQLLVLFIALDNDDNPNNGIDIIDSATSYTNDSTIDLSDPEAVQDLINDIRPDVTEDEVGDFLDGITSNDPVISVLIDGYVVEGLTYTLSDGQVFTTDSTGQIICTPGETVTFSIGSLIIGTAVCSGSISFAEIAGSEASATQLLLILISLDEDNNPSNGVDIIDDGENYNGDTSIDLTDPDAVQDLIDDIDPNAPDVTEEEAGDLLDDIETNDPAISILIDGYIIEGLTYTLSDGQIFTTDSTGLITCTPGENVTFSIGSLIVGTAVCSGNISFEEIAGGPDQAAQLLLILLSLDEDNNPSNGVDIIDDGENYNGDTSIDLTDPDAVQDLINDIDPNAPDVTVDEVDDLVNGTGDTVTTINTLINGYVISGLSYTLPSGQTYTTDASGLITCTPSENVVFSLGSLILGNTNCSTNMSFVDIAGSEAAAAQLLLILLSLDSDNNPSNGVDIIDDGENYDGDTSIDLTDPNAVQDLIDDIAPNAPDVTEEEAGDLLDDVETNDPIISLLINGLVIEGLSYTLSDGQTLTTDANGFVTCTPGELVTFSIGSLVLGSATCSGSLTFEDIAGGEDEATQLLLILMSLDEDDNPYNGINLIDSSNDYDGDTTIDLTDPDAVQDIIDDIIPDTTTEDAGDLLDDINNTNPPINTRIDGLIIEGLSYTSIGGENAVTNSSGYINCRPDQTIVLSIGTVELGTAVCSFTMTLREIAGTSNAAIQLSLLLLTLDIDSNASNGIQIVDSAANYNGNATVDLNSPASVQSLIDILYPGAPDIDEEDAEDFLFITEDTNNPKPELNIKLSGVVIDGLRYRNSREEFAVTNNSGNIVCKAGENIRYFIGSVGIGTQTCKPDASIFDLAGSADKAINLLIFLMSLDTDLDTSNGLDIVTSARNYTGASTLILENQTLILDLIEELNPGATPVTETQALDFLSTLSAIDMLIADTIIEGLSYNSNLTGDSITDDTGVISCIKPEEINLKIGNVDIGSLECQTKVNFISLAGSYDKAYQLIRILISFDVDYDTLNGIELIEEASTFSGIYDLDLGNLTNVDNFIELIRPGADIVEENQITELLNSAIFSGTVTAEDIDRTEGQCPTGEASLSKSSDGLIQFDMPSTTSALDLTSLIEDVEETVDSSTQLSTVVFPIEDSAGDYNILNCNAGGGYSNRVEISIENIPLSSSVNNPPTESVIKIYQVCNNGLEKVFCQGKFRY